MKPFIEHSNEDYITEVFNSSHEYYMTDDTVMPNLISALTEINGTTYFLEMEANKEGSGLYSINFGIRSPSGKKMSYRFKNTKDVYPLFSTAIHFGEACLAFLGQRVSGISLRVPGSNAKGAKINRLTRFLSVIVAKSHVKAFKVMKAKFQEEETPKKYAFVFLIRKNRNPASVFTSGGHKTWLNVIQETGEIPSEILDDLTPKKKSKPTVTEKPSTKFSFGKLNVEISFDDPNFVEAMSNVTAAPASTSDDPDAMDPSKADKNLTHKEVADQYDHDTHMAYIFSEFKKAPQLSNMNQKLEYFGFDEDKLNWNNLKYIIDAAFGNNKSVKASMEKISLSLNPKGAEYNWKTVLKKYAEMLSKDSKPGEFLGVNYEAMVDGYSNVKSGASSGEKGNSEKIQEYSTFAQGDLPPVASQWSAFSGLGSDTKYSSWQEGNFNLDEAVNTMEYTWGYKEEILNMPTFASVKKYTGSSYEEANAPLRDAFRDYYNAENLDDETRKVVYTNIEKAMNRKMTRDVMKSFDLVTPIPEAFWTFRGISVANSDISEVASAGQTYVNPGIVSTTLFYGHSYVNRNMSMKIFVPKGARVLPVLSSSAYPTEKEVILPPLSVFKILSREREGFGNNMITCVYIGSLYNSMKEDVDKYLKENYQGEVWRHIVEAEKKTSKSFEQAMKDKHKEPVDDLNKKLADLVKNGKLKPKR